MLRRWLSSFLVGGIALAFQAKVDPQSLPSRAPTNSLIREEERVVVKGVSETWRLERKSPPQSMCGSEDMASAITCPCSGFAYGESGRLDLIRLVNGREVDRLELTPLFEQIFADQHGAILQRWDTQTADYKDSKTQGFSGRVRSRPIVKIIRLGDYNHDGQATEFYLQTGAEPCGKTSGIIVGLTSRRPRLHAFTSIAKPNKPLYLQKREWEALLNAPGPIEVLDWPCGDHGSEKEDSVKLSVTNGGSIQAIRRTFECTQNGKRGRLLQEKAF
jgi:hypothetical protein